MTISLIDARADTASAARIASDVLHWLSVEPGEVEHMYATRPTHDGDTAMQVGTYEEFRGRFLAGPRFIPEATFVALAGDEVVGYGQLCWMNRAAGVGDHEMLAVRRRWRGKGVARALKAAQIAWAIDHGLSEIRTNNEERNTPVRAVNAHFPYAPLPEKLLYRGPCASTQLRGHS